MTPAMRPNWRSSGVATEEAIVSGLAPGRPAVTEMVGKSTCGSGETGSSVIGRAPPASASATVSSVVATGRWMKGAEMFMRRSAGRQRPALAARRRRRACRGRSRCARRSKQR